MFLWAGYEFVGMVFFGKVVLEGIWRVPVLGVMIDFGGNVLVWEIGHLRLFDCL